MESRAPPLGKFRALCLLLLQQLNVQEMQDRPSGLQTVSVEEIHLSQRRRQDSVVARR